jgi:hypothetical protein
MASPDLSPLPGSDVIGCSYDVFGYYANPKSAKRQLFTFADQRQVNAVDSSWLLSTDFQMQMINDSLQSHFNARIKDNYSRDLAASVNVTGSYSFFSASVESDFSSSISTASDTTYTHIIANVEKWKLSLKNDIQGLRSKMTADFKENLARMDPTELFERYGTHFLSEVIVGGRANFIATTKTSAFESETKLRVAAEASFKQVSSKTSVTDEESVKKFRSNSYSSLYTIGGSALADIRDNEEYSAWLKSIDKHPVFCTFTRDSLTPIWKLAETESRRQELQGVTRTFVPRYVMRPALTDLTCISASTWDVQPPYGFTKIEYDLNKGAKGKFIFVCHKIEKIPVARRPGDPEPITSIEIVAGDDWNPPIPSGYQKIEKDLNEGAGGKYVFMCFSKDPAKAEEGLPIRGLTVIAGGDNDRLVAPYGFTQIGVDLNMGAGGEFIYLCYSRHLDTPW